MTKVKHRPHKQHNIYLQRLKGTLTTQQITHTNHLVCDLTSMSFRDELPQLQFFLSLFVQLLILSHAMRMLGFIGAKLLKILDFVCHLIMDIF